MVNLSKWIGTVGNDYLTIAETFSTLSDGYVSIDGGAGWDTMILIGAGQSVGDAAFNGVYNFENLALTSGAWSFSFGAAAAAAFSGNSVQIDGSRASTINVDGSSLINTSTLTIYGSTGSDLMIGGPGDNYFESGGGADMMIGGLGNNTFFFNNLSGLLAAHVYGGGGVNTGYGSASGNNSIVLYGNDPLTDNIFLNIHNMKYFNLASAGVAQHVVLGAAAGAAFGGFVGLYANNASILYLDATNVVGGIYVHGSGGADTLLGGVGNDVFYFNSGDAMKAAFVDGGAGINDLTLETDANIVDADFIQIHNATYLNLLGAGVQQITLGPSAAAAAASNLMSINALASSSLVLDASAFQGQIHVFGSTGADRFVAGIGTEWFSGNGGPDTFVFHPGSGTDAVMDFVTHTTGGTATLEFDGYSKTQVQAMLASAQETNGDTWLYNGLGDAVGLYGVHKADLTLSDFAWS